MKFTDWHIEILHDVTMFVIIITYDISSSSSYSYVSSSSSSYYYDCYYIPSGKLT